MVIISTDWIARRRQRPRYKDRHPAVKAGCRFSFILCLLLTPQWLQAGARLTLTYQDLARQSAERIVGEVSGWELDSSGQVTFIRFKSGGEPYTAFIDEVKGKTQLITYLLLLNGRGEVVDVDVLVYRESYGGEIDYPVFRKQFAGKSGTEPPVWNRNIRNISGATISCRSITAGVARLLKFNQLLLTTK